jgi:hypothetical protein
MSLLREIQNAAIDSAVPLATLLRKCKVLAARLGNAEFKQWIEAELNGYSSIDGLPPYRVLNVQSKGHFSGPFQSGLRNADIPLSCVPEQVRNSLSHCYLREPIAALESLVADSDGGSAQEPWNPDLVAYVAGNIYEGMNCMQAWKVIPINRVVAALDTVRTRILNFVLEIEAEAPDAGEAPVNSNPVPQDRVHQIFNTYISGNVQNLATASTNVRQYAKLKEGNAKLFSEILTTLSKSSADRKIVRRALEAVEEMRDSDSAENFKKSYLKFMSVLADHVQVLGPVLTPYLPALSALLP